MPSGHLSAAKSPPATTFRCWPPRSRLQGRQAPAAYQQASREEQAFEGCDVNLLDAWGRHKPLSTYEFSPNCRTWLRQRLADPLRAPDVVHFHGVFSHVTTLAAVESRRHGVPYVIRPCGILNAHCFNSGRAWLKRLFIQLFLRRHLQAAAFVHVTSESEAEELTRFVPRNKIRTVPLGVDVRRLPESSIVERFLTRRPQSRRTRPRSRASAGDGGPARRAP